MSAPSFKVQDVPSKELDETLFGWLTALSESWSSGQAKTPPDNRAQFAFTHIDDSKIRASLLTLDGVGYGEQGITGLSPTTLFILLGMYVKGMHRRADNGPFSLVLLDLWRIHSTGLPIRGAAFLSPT
jgi:hypothetical protein